MQRMVKAFVMLVSLGSSLALAQTAAPSDAPARRCDTTITLGGDALFGANKAMLSDGARSKIELDIMNRIEGCASLESVTISGHADRLESGAQALSLRRAEAVREQLVRRGLARAKIQTMGMAAAAPAKFCSEEKGAALMECLAPNRRVSVDIQGVAK
jgi:outer membrane protein OmpA-like peptidoglycan-associated protein